MRTLVIVAWWPRVTSRPVPDLSIPNFAVVYQLVDHGSDGLPAIALAAPDGLSPSPSPPGPNASAAATGRSVTGWLTCGLAGVGVTDGLAVGFAAGLVSAAAEVAGEADVLALADALACAAVESAAFLAVVDPAARRTPITVASTRTTTAPTPTSRRRRPCPVRGPDPGAPAAACGRALPAG